MINTHSLLLPNYGAAQFKLDIYTRVTRQISHATCELHARKSLKYTFTCVSL